MSCISKNEIDIYGKAGAIAEEVFSNIRTVIAFGGEGKEFKRYSTEVTSARKSGILREFMTGMTMGILYFVVYSFYGLGLWYGVKTIKDEEESDEFKHCFNNCTLEFSDQDDDVLACMEGCREFSTGKFNPKLQKLF